MRAPTVGQLFLCHERRHALVHHVEVIASPREQRFERTSFLRRLWMQRKVHPLYFEPEVPPQSLNTPGTEVAPGSNEVGVDAEYCGHRLQALGFRNSISAQALAPEDSRTNARWSTVHHS